MVTTIRTNSRNNDFIELVKQLDAELAVRDGADHSFYAQFNAIVNIRHAVVAYESGMPVACGAWKEFGPGTVEVKRMFTVPAMRGKGIAVVVLTELEQWAGELAYTTCILETGMMQPEAIRLYKKSGYTQIPNYGQYIGVENSLCFEKMIQQ